MANSYVEYVGDGATTTFSVTFPYIDQSHVSVLVSDVETAFSWLTASTISITPAPANGATVRIERNTPDSLLVNFTAPNLLTAANLNLMARQAFYRSIEAEEAQPLPVMPAPENRVSTLFSYNADGVFELRPIGSVFEIDGAITELPADAVSTVNIVDNAVTTPKINDDAVTQAKIAAGAVDTAQLANGAVTVEKINDIAALTDALTGNMITPGGRLTVVSGDAVPDGDNWSATSVYYTPFAHSRVPIYNGSSWTMRTFSEIALALTSSGTIPHEGAHDVFLFDDSGTLRLGSSQAYSGNARVDAISRLGGLWVNTSSIQLRYGSGSGDLTTVVASRALYVGTFQTTSAGETCDSESGVRFLWNTYNRVARPVRVFEPTDSWSFSTASYRIANDNGDNRLDLVRGLDEDAVVLMAMGCCTNSDANPYTVRTAIGLDSTTTIAGVSGTAHPTSSSVGTALAFYSGLPGDGYHYLAWLERGAGVATQTWFGDAGSPAESQVGMVGVVMA